MHTSLLVACCLLAPLAMHTLAADAPSRTHDVPQWARGAVWYQIFPERFRNGNPGNDPTGSAVFLAPWRSDWYSVQPGELEAWKQRRGIDDSRWKPHREGPLYNVIWDRRYGGDLQGVLEKLDELADLGITAIYLNPIFEAQSLHKYDASDFRHIDQRLAHPGTALPQDGTYTPPEGETDDPATWTWTPADRWFIDVFLPACKARKIRVVLDGVWNHTGREFWAFQHVKQHGRSSPYADWFLCEFGELGTLTGWSGWDGKNGHLPEFRQVKGGLDRDRDATVAKGDLNAGIKEHIFAVTKRWMDPNNDGDPSDGIDGWRLDVAGEIGGEFWTQWRALVKSINPEAITIAEIWGNAREEISGGSFDAQMFYPFAYPVLDWLRDMDPKKRAVSSERLGERLTEAFAGMPHATATIQQTLLASHDTDRYVNMLWNPGREYDRDCNVQEGASRERPNDPSYVPYREGRPPAEIYELSVLGLAIQATYLGSPMVYYGDEVGMWGADDPTCRKPYPWSDVPIDQVVPASQDENADSALRERYRAWLRLRAEGSAWRDVLRLGTVRHIATQSPDVFAFVREHEGRSALVVVNRGAHAFDASRLLSRVGIKDGEARMRGVSARAWLTERMGDELSATLLAEMNSDS